MYRHHAGPTVQSRSRAARRPQIPLRKLQPARTARSWRSRPAESSSAAIWWLMATCGTGGSAATRRCRREDRGVIGCFHFGATTYASVKRRAQPAKHSHGRGSQWAATNNTGKGSSTPRSGEPNPQSRRCWRFDAPAPPNNFSRRQNPVRRTGGAEGVSAPSDQRLRCGVRISGPNHAGPFPHACYYGVLPLRLVGRAPRCRSWRAFRHRQSAESNRRTTAGIGFTVNQSRLRLLPVPAVDNADSRSGSPGKWTKNFKARGPQAGNR